MSIFRRDSDPPSAVPVQHPARPKSPPRESGKRITHVAPGSKLVGLISGKTEVLVEGDLEGEIKVDSRVVVGPQGRLKGNIAARSVQIAGHLAGHVQGLERVELTATAKLEGNLAAPRVIIAEGAYFKGQIEMTGSVPSDSVKESRPTGGATAGSAGAEQGRRAPHEGRDPKGS